MWRIAGLADDDAIVRMCLALNAEDPGSDPVPAQNTRQTLLILRKEPHRGCAVVLELEGRVCGYSLLISFWSNELGGEVCFIDEIYVESERRGRRYASALIEDLAARTGPYPPSVVALMLEITPNNTRARRLYERLGFHGPNTAMRRRLLNRTGFLGGLIP